MPINRLKKLNGQDDLAGLPARHHPTCLLCNQRGSQYSRALASTWVGEGDRIALALPLSSMKLAVRVALSAGVPAPSQPESVEAEPCRDRSRAAALDI